MTKFQNLGASGWSMLALGVVFAVLLPIFLIAVNVVYITDSDWLYTYNWWRNGVSERIGLPVSELDSAADQIKEYFANDAERLDVRVNTSRGIVSLFDERETLHMIDVKDLMRYVAAVSVWSGVGLVLCTALGLAIRRREFFASMSRWLRWCALVWGLIIAAVVVIAIIDFTWIFTQFHLLSFANDLWQLDPFRHYLLLLFPERFFLEATLFIALLTVIEFAGLYVGARLVEIRFSRDQS
ncbi:MAG: TIGR01906 family membrane protein [Chloroflexi bacterium]|nr:TIGR01906 family membrane protein [Chloroflexota bacterium]MYK60505.1 TIGR01906 family membrane protein [Chloroflexota bacterium]